MLPSSATPSFPATWHWDARGYVLFHLERYADAIKAFRSVRAEPFWIVGMLAAAYALAGYPNDARRQLKCYLTLRPGATLATASDKIVYAKEDMRQRWLRRVYATQGRAAGVNADRCNREAGLVKPFDLRSLALCAVNPNSAAGAPR
jgi:hypothetical protein